MGLTNMACLHCGLVRPVRDSRIANGKDKYCSMLCRRTAMAGQTQERECEWCGASFTARTSASRAGHGRFCSTSCSRFGMWANRPAGAGYRVVQAPGHPLADSTGKAGEHRLLLYGKIGPGAMR